MRLLHPRKLARPALLACAALAAACGLGCTRRGPAPNVVLILVDTLRADRMSLYGYARATTPRLGALASTAVVFDGAHSQTSCTFASVNSILTSRHPSRFFDQPFGDMSIPPSMPTLARILKEHGYATYAVSASLIVRATPSKINRTGGFQHGFDEFDESCAERTAACVSARAIAHATSAHQPFFAYLHYMEPHHPYHAPFGFLNHFARPIAADPRILNGNPTPILASLYKRHEQRDWSREIKYLSDSYDDEVRYFDAELEPLLRRLRETSDGRPTVVVLAADHGEDFLEHGDLMHCRTVYETSIHVPLVMWLPGVAGRRVRGTVRNLDILPTLLDYLGIDAAPYRPEGTSLRSAIERGRASEPAYALQSELRTLVDGDEKLIYDLASGRAQLYDLAHDPGETNDLVTLRPEEARALEKRVLERVAATEGGGDTRRAARASHQVQDRLRALGYLE